LQRTLPEPPFTASLSVDSERSPYWTILRLSTPTVLAMLTQGFVSEVDAVLLGRLPSPTSSTAQAAFIPSLILLWVFGGSLSAISVGTQALTARRFAERRLEQAGGVLANALSFALIAGAVFTALGYLLLPFILETILRVPQVRGAATDFLRWRLLGITPMVLSFALKAFFDGIGKTHVYLVACAVMNAFNLALSYAFIFGKWGAPGLGITGAGVSGLIATFIGFGILLGYAFRPEYRAFRPFDGRKVNLRALWSILRLSIPSGIATLAVMSGFAIFVTIVSHLDETARRASSLAASAEAVNGAATTVIVILLKLTFTSCLAFGTSTATLVSQSLGERDPAKAARFGWASVHLGLVVFGVLGLCEGVFFTWPLLHFVTKSEAVAHAAVIPMRLMGLSSPLIAVGMILTQALFGAGNTRFVMGVELVLHFTCLVPLAWFLGVVLGGGLVGIWVSAVVYIALLAAVMSWKFASGDWARIRL